MRPSSRPKSVLGSRLALTALALAGVLFPSLASAADKVRAGKAVTSSFFFSMVELGKEQGHYAAQNIDIDISTFNGDGRLQQAMAAGVIDFGFGSGPGMGYAAKGSPAIAVAAIADLPLNMALIVATDSKVKNVDELKGAKIAVTTAGSLTDWLARKLSDSKGWGPSGIDVLAMGDTRTRIAAMKRGDIAGFVAATEVALNLEQQGVARLLTTFGDAVPDFHTHVIFAQRKIIADNPDLVRRFLRGWFTTARFVKTHKAETVKSIAATMKVPEKTIEAAYDKELAMINPDGAFRPAALEIIRASLKDLDILDRVPEVKELYAPGFAPIAP